LAKIPALGARFVVAFVALILFSALAPGRGWAAPSAVVVMDARSGAVLFERNADTRLHPASLTKMLTLYIAFDAVRRGEISLDTMVRISANAAAEPPSRLGLKAGQRISLRHLIRAAALRSANDAATAIGEAISGSEAAFAARMTRTAKALGMTRSTFRNAHGLTADGHLSTARDMTVLGRRLFYDFPEYYNLFSRRNDDAGIARVANTNRRFLDAYRGADGIKTGYTRAAGFNLTASAERGNKRIVATVFGGTSTAQRNARMAELLDLGFGKAPAAVAVRRPPPVSLDAVASAPAGTARTSAEPGQRVAAAKTIRLQTAVASSPRPRPRPTAAPPEAVLVAMDEGIRSVLADVAEPPADPAPPAAPPPAAAAQTAAAPAVSPVPAPRPEPTETAATAVAEQTAAPADPPVRPEVVAATSGPAEPAPEEPVVTFAVAAIDPETATETLAEPIADLAHGTGDPDAAPDPGTRPQPRPGEILMTAAGMPPVAASTAPEPRPVIVTRMSTSGGRQWGVTLGRFPSRGLAERALLQTALKESATLNGSLRKVVQRGGGFEANYVGLTQDEADLACRRLQARAIQCFTLGP
jgi:D-alanyl-D-alanine carboxypeptidase